MSFKHNTSRLVVKWVDISESLLLYVFDIFAAPKLTRRNACAAIKSVSKNILELTYF
jgi:hypothetical protein